MRIGVKQPTKLQTRKQFANSPMHWRYSHLKDIIQAIQKIKEGSTSIGKGSAE